MTDIPALPGTLAVYEHPDSVLDQRTRPVVLWRDGVAMIAPPAPHLLDPDSASRLIPAHQHQPERGYRLQSVHVPDLVIVDVIQDAKAIVIEDQWAEPVPVLGWALTSDGRFLPITEDAKGVVHLDQSGLWAPSDPAT